MNKIALNYGFDENDKHTIDAFTLNRSEREFLNFVQEISKRTGIKCKIIAEPKQSGSFEEVLQFIAENKETLLIICGLLLQMRPPQKPKDSAEDLEDKEIDRELKKLKIAKLRQELETDSINGDTVEEAVEELNHNNKIIHSRSNFYRCLQADDEIKTFKSKKLNTKNEIIEEFEINRDEFPEFIVEPGELEPLIIDNAEITIIAPVLEANRQQWKGRFKGEIITFKMGDSEYKDQVISGLEEFRNGTRIFAELEIRRKLDDAGEVKQPTYKVLTVYKSDQNGEIRETPQGRTRKEEKQTHQLDLFRESENRW